MAQKKSPVVYDGYVNYEEAVVDRLAIKQDFRDNEKNESKRPPVGHFGFSFCEICHRLSLCKTSHLFHIHGPDILHCFGVR